jgi:hypothetical protein
LLQHAGSNPLFYILPAAILNHDRVNSLQIQKV